MLMIKLVMMPVFKKVIDNRKKKKSRKCSNKSSDLERCLSKVHISSTPCTVNPHTANTDGKRKLKKKKKRERDTARHISWQKIVADANYSEVADNCLLLFDFKLSLGKGRKMRSTCLVIHRRGHITQTLHFKWIYQKLSAILFRPAA